MHRVLLADDDVELCELLEDYLGGEGLHVESVHDGRAAVERLRGGGVDIAVLDVMMPHLDGFEALRAIRRESSVPVLMLTARGEDVDRIVGLEMGADDYLLKPCNPRELVARIRAILRRSGEGGPAAGAGARKLVAGDLSLDAARRETLVGGTPVGLTATEFNVLEVLMHAAGTVVTKDDLARRALGRRLGRFDRSIDVHVSNLRKKLGDATDRQPRIRSVRGVGYILAAPEQP